MVFWMLLACQSEKLLEDDTGRVVDSAGYDSTEDWDPYIDAMTHLQALQQIANSNNGNRAVGTDGYTASADYVVSELTAAGYEIERQVFSVFSMSCLRQYYP